LKRLLKRERRRSARLLTSLRDARSDVQAYRLLVKSLKRKIYYLKRR
jgi:hypothetical protein